MLAAKLASPKAKCGDLHHSTLDRAADRAITLISCPPGYFFADSLANILSNQGRPTLWLRLDAEECDPGTLLVSLIEGAKHLKPGVGAHTMQQLISHPGPLFGWPALYGSLADELSGELPATSVIVLEHIHILKLNQPSLRLLSTHLLSKLPDQIPRILISHEDLPPGDIPKITNLIEQNDLKFKPQDYQNLAINEQSGFPINLIHRLSDLIEGREVALRGILSAYESLGPVYLEQALNRSKNANQLMAQLARALLSTVEPGTLQALALTKNLAYSHPRLLDTVLGNAAPPEGPWVQSLDDEWVRLRRIWEMPLENALGRKIIPNHAALQSAARYLADQGAEENAIQIYYRLNDFQNAAKLLVQISERMMNRGQWSTLAEWLDRLPTEVLQNWPWLVYTRGELAAVSGQTGIARRTFALSASLFASRYERQGACQSLLAESTLTAWENDLERAKSCARSADSLAQAAGLTWHQGWAAWQLGCLSVLAGDLDSALVYFSQASNAVQAPPVTGLFEQVEALALKQREIRVQEELHRQAQLTLQQTEQDISAKLHFLTRTPPENLPDLFSNFGWSNTPLILKLPMPEQFEEPQSIKKPGLWQSLLNALYKRGRVEKSETGHVTQLVLPMHEFASPAMASLLYNPLTTSIEKPGDKLLPDALSTNKNLTSEIITSEYVLAKSQKQLISDQRSSVSQGPLVESSKKPKPGLELTAYLLGDFRVSINDQPVEKWPGSRGLAVFKYLLAYKGKEIKRDVLMDVFWPGASPEAARNNLNVTFYKLRQAFSVVTNEQVVLFERGNYHLNPIMQVWIDIDEFERCAQGGRQLELNGQLNAAIDEYELATNLYQGDFLSEDPYEDWAINTRERLRVGFLDILDRLSRIYFGQGQYTACATLCLRILECDNCREDAHCRLMRCFSRQSQHNLALRQYQVCTDILRKELDVDPDPATSQLAEHIRRHERV